MISGGGISAFPWHGASREWRSAFARHGKLTGLADVMTIGSLAIATVDGRLLAIAMIPRTGRVVLELCGDGPRGGEAKAAARRVAKQGQVRRWCRGGGRKRKRT